MNKNVHYMMETELQIIIKWPCASTVVAFAVELWCIEHGASVFSLRVWYKSN